jgi:anti-sigma-K factor RskA
MPATGRSQARQPRVTKDARARVQDNGRALDRVAKSLETAQADLSALRGTMGAGAGDLRKDISRLLRDARRDVGKLSKALKRDLERIQKDLAAAAPKPSVRTRGGSRTATSRSSTRGKRRTTSKRTAAKCRQFVPGPSWARSRMSDGQPAVSFWSAPGR